MNQTWKHGDRFYVQFKQRGLMLSHNGRPLDSEPGSIEYYDLDANGKLKAYRYPSKLESYRVSIDHARTPWTPRYALRASLRSFNRPLAP